MQAELKPVATALLQARVDGQLKNPTQVLEIVQRKQPTYGFNNQEWTDICAFVLTLESANNIPNAKKVAELHGLEISY
jgi:hypothetical protein